MLRAIVHISLLLLLAVSCQRETQATETLSIASLHNIESGDRGILLTENIVLEGCVTANDEYGEFYNYIIIEDDSAAVKVMCDMENNYRSYPYGTSVKIYCSGLYLINHYGSLTLGAEPTGEYTLDYISSSDLGIYLKISETQDSVTTPLALRIDELTPLHALRQVVFEDISISNPDGITTFCSRDPLTGRKVDTTHIITDSQGNSMELYVDQYCNYGDAQLPPQSCSIIAIIDYFYGLYSAMITNMNYKAT